ncbi:hypothetical protein EVG20_g9116 [Dentipellis fragilis]|uniref:Nucleotide-diphospho-sugar transferase domain-containing protein n=1 Tax=Dentipellis fragilis TaxID=205917 RepID=A0A4Y9Y0T3_9AGAM|nr:hypothetical protein EVG20_g9116 [Dentipellis fragilis]
MNLAEEEHKPLLSTDGDDDTATVVPDVDQPPQPSASTSSGVPTFTQSQCYPYPPLTEQASWWTRFRARSWRPTVPGPRLIPAWASSSGPIYLPTMPTVDKLRSKRRRIFLGFLFIVLIGLGIANLVVTIVKWKHTSRRYYGGSCTYTRSNTPLDNYHIMKDNMELLVPQPGPNTTAIVTALGDESADILPLLILGHSISQHYSTNSSSPTPDPTRLMMYMPGSVSAYSLCLARSVGWMPHAITSRTLKAQHDAELRYIPFRNQQAPLALWSLEHEGVERAVYLDAGSLVRGRFDELFTLPFGFAATSDARNETAFSTNVLAVRPSMDIFHSLVARMVANQPYHWQRSPLQERLNAFFAAEAVRLPYAYNAQLAVKARSRDMWDMIAHSEGVLKIAHFDQLAQPSSRPWGMRTNGTEMMRIARMNMHTRVEQFKTWWMAGMYKEEVGWWDDVWAEMEEERRKDFQRCEVEDVSVDPYSRPYSVY